MLSVRNGVVSDCMKKTSIGSSSYWCEMRKRMAKVKGMKSCESLLAVVHGMDARNETYEEAF